MLGVVGSVWIVASKECGNVRLVEGRGKARALETPADAGGLYHGLYIEIAGRRMCTWGKR